MPNMIARVAAVPERTGGSSTKKTELISHVIITGKLLGVQINEIRGPDCVKEDDAAATHDVDISASCMDCCPPGAAKLSSGGGGGLQYLPTLTSLLVSSVDCCLPGVATFSRRRRGLLPALTSLLVSSMDCYPLAVAKYSGGGVWGLVSGEGEKVVMEGKTVPEEGYQRFC